ncbi:unnamed protein product [Eruca vesicaria subsp. sativa]|uniref:Uncharacterized protein n=1 Tax=Eruca vesicaria subsp. sativa TaxID=29727 RepID=A0ABC8JUS9_ERUVS|nr:unnamed protein product [Eruca vesicaria subsp. sativa]
MRFFNHGEDGFDWEDLCDSYESNHRGVGSRQDFRWIGIKGIVGKVAFGTTMEIFLGISQSDGFHLLWKGRFSRSFFFISWRSGVKGMRMLQGLDKESGIIWSFQWDTEASARFSCGFWGEWGDLGITQFLRFI